MANEEWTDREIAAAVLAYVDMLAKWRGGIPFSKAAFNKALQQGPLSARSKGSIEYRMQNISAVVDEMGFQWLQGYKPARNVGPKVKAIIQDLLSTMQIPDLQAEPQKFEAAVTSLRKKISSKGPLLPPEGSASVKRVSVTKEMFVRDPKVKAWVLHNAHGVCEACDSKAPFISADGLPFLETHHVIPLSENGPDTINNTVALCPNCHRRMHQGADRDEFRAHLITKLPRLMGTNP